jgi:hypothetical protein
VEADIAQDGTYKAVKVTAGMNKIAVYYPNPAFKKIARPKGPPDPNMKLSSESVNLTPEMYATVDTSGLATQVGHGTVYNVDMTGPAIP